MKTFARYLTSSKRGTGFFLHVISVLLSCGYLCGAPDLSRIFLAVQYGVPRYFTFAVLPFGLSSACFCFTKLLRPLVKRSRSMSHSSLVHLVIDLVRHLNSCSGRGTLIILEWPSTSFWPFLRERSSQFKSFVVDVFVLPAITDLLLEAPGQRQIYASCLLFFEVARSSECWLCA